MRKDLQSEALQFAMKMKTDLVDASGSYCCCGECAKYRWRRFSISGRDKRYPKMPQNIDCSCPCIGVIFQPVYESSASIHYGHEADLVAISNRPFVDDREDWEIESYEIRRLKLDNEIFWSEFSERWDAARKYDHEQYELLVKRLPDIVPKSYNGYMRMKKGNTANYKKLVTVAEDNGIFLEYPAEIVIDMQLLAPKREQYIKTLSEVHRRELELKRTRGRK